MKLLLKTKVNASLERVKSKFNQQLFEYMTPPWTKTEIERFDGCKSGDEIHVMVYQGKVKSKWVSLITKTTDTNEEWSFVDEGAVLPWPMSKWYHLHKVEKISENEVCIEDDIFYECSPAFMTKAIYPIVWATFAIRPKRYKEYFEV